MGTVAKETIALAQYLLPGFLAAWIFYGLTSHPRPDQFERVVQALIFTLITQAIVFLEKSTLLAIGQYWKVGTWTADSEVVCATITAGLLGAVFAYFANNDGFHRLARRLGITRETSFPSEWFGAFLKNVTYVVLHLKDDRRLYGWPNEWPSEPKRGHFILVQASWLTEDVGKPVEKPITGVESVLVNVEDVKWVEFMHKTWEQRNEPKSP
ncbi:MAG: DUF6338 family protein [Burkholderiales bacterium]